MIPFFFLYLFSLCTSNWLIKYRINRATAGTGWKQFMEAKHWDSDVSFASEYGSYRLGTMAKLKLKEQGSSSDSCEIYLWKSSAWYLDVKCQVPQESVFYIRAYILHPDTSSVSYLAPKANPKLVSACKIPVDSWGTWHPIWRYFTLRNSIFIEVCTNTVF
jgi:hypothetical protein